MLYIRIEGTNKEDKRRRGHRRMFKGITDGDRCVFLDVDKVEGKKLKERDRRELLKLGEWLESQAPRDTEGIEEATAYDIGRLYMYIMLKAKGDSDFLNWWLSYNFKILKYCYDYRNEIITVRA